MAGKDSTLLHRSKLKEKLLNSELSHEELKWLLMHKNTKSDLVNSPIVLGIGFTLPPWIQTTQQLWDRLQQGQGHSLPADLKSSDFPQGEDHEAFRLALKNRVPGEFLNSVDIFCPHRFGISPKEAKYIDPLQRLMMMTVDRCIQDSGYTMQSISGKNVGVFSALSSDDFAHLSSRHVSEKGLVYEALGTSRATSAGRISHAYKFTGPSLQIDTACSSSLVAFHLASESIRNGECEFAIVCTSNLILTEQNLLKRQSLTAVSKQGQCRPFDSLADGFVQGEGAVSFLLANESKVDAARAGLSYGRVIATGINHNGGANGLTAPNGASQVKLIEQTLKNSGISRGEIGLLEAHGTATNLGDPIELEAIDKTYGKHSEDLKPLFVSSVKSTFGHLEAAAGSLSLLKLILQLKYEKILPQSNYTSPTPHFKWDSSRLQVPLNLEEWLPNHSGERTGAVSSFGITGTNAHVILQKKETDPSSIVEDQKYPIVISAESPESLEEYSEAIGNLAKTEPLSTIASSLIHTRELLSYRRILKPSKSLSSESFMESAKGQVSGESEKVAFILSGQGSQLENMGQHLYSKHPLVKERFDLADSIFRKSTGEDFLNSIWGSNNKLLLTEYQQPALFVYQYAMGELLLELGLEPDLFIGHSIGELAAACLCQKFQFEEMMRFATERGQAMAADSREGAMLAIRKPSEFIDKKFLSFFSELHIAVVNSEKDCVVSGPKTAVLELQNMLKKQAILCSVLPVSNAFHSPLMDGAVSKLKGRTPTPSDDPVEVNALSNLDGLKVGDRWNSADYWLKQILSPVQFNRCIEEAHKMGVRVFLELSPKSVLAASILKSFPGTIARKISEELPFRDLEPILYKNLNDGKSVKLARVCSAQPEKFLRLPVPQPKTSGFWPSWKKSEKEDSVQNNINKSGDIKTMPDKTLQKTVLTLKKFFSELLELDVSLIDENQTLISMGADSFVLVAAVSKIEENFGVSIAVKDMFERTDTIRKIAIFMTKSEKFEEPETQSSEFQIIHSEQNDHLVDESVMTQPLLKEPAFSFKPVVQEPKHEVQHFDALTPQQNQYVSELTQKYTLKTKGSRDYKLKYGTFLCNNRKSSSGFRDSTKALCYPLICKESQGAKVVDIDGNEYVDFSMGFGATLMGHRPEVVQKAIGKIIDEGVQVGPESHLAGPCAKLLCELTGFDRATFHNSGTEAVMTAIRFARAASKKRKIVIFNNSYHGHFDGTMAVPDMRNGEGATSPMALGVPDSYIEDTVVLPYNSDKGFAYIRSHCNEIAAVLVEPVPNKLPGVDSGEFLKQLRQLTTNLGVILIFDEIVTGFRLAPGGGQEFFGVRADMATYGKVIGGGFAIGAVAGPKWIMDLTDGGHWTFDPSSTPFAETSFTAGTFCKHPVSMAACFEILSEVKRLGRQIYNQLQSRTDLLVTTLSKVFEYHQVPLSVANSGSFFRFSQNGNLSFAFQPLELDIFFYSLALHGIYNWEGKTCFVSTAHSDGDIQKLIDVIHHVLGEMKSYGFWENQVQPSPSLSKFLNKPEFDVPKEISDKATIPQDSRSPFSGSALEGLEKKSFLKDNLVEKPKRGSLTPLIPSAHQDSSDYLSSALSEVKDEKLISFHENVYPLTSDQKMLYFLAKLNADASRAFQQTMAFRFKGKVRPDGIEKAYLKVMARHESLRSVVDELGENQVVLEKPDAKYCEVDLRNLGSEARELKLKEILRLEAESEFEINNNILHRLTSINMSDDESAFLFTSHHIFFDGVAMGIFLNELMQFINADLEKRALNLEPPIALSRLYSIRNQDAYRKQIAKELSYWKSKIESNPEVEVRLQTDRPRPPVKTFKGRRKTITLEKKVVDQLKNVAKDTASTPYMIAFTAFCFFLQKLSQQDNVVVGLPFSGRSHRDFEDMIHFFANIYPFHVKFSDFKKTKKEYLSAVRSELLSAYENQMCPFGELLGQVPRAYDASRTPLFNILFNWDRVEVPVSKHFTVETIPFELRYVEYDLLINIMEVDGALDFYWDFNSELFSDETIANFSEQFLISLEGFCGDLNEELATIQFLPSQFINEDKEEEFASVPKLLEDSMNKNSTAIAVMDDNLKLSYDDFNQKVRRLRQFLRSLGVKKGDIVALDMPPGFHLPMAIHAVLGLGGVCLPLNRRFERSRNVELLDSVSCQWLLTDNISAKPLKFDITQIDVREGINNDLNSYEDNGIVNVGPNDVAYMLFTSGSTGTPKCVEITHTNLSWYFQSLRALMPSCRGRRFLNIAPSSFDISLTDLVGCFLFGGRLSFVTEEERLDPEAILRKLRAHNIEFMQATPSIWATLVSQNGIESLDLIAVAAGEKVSSELALKMINFSSQFWNCYGPTEATIWTTANHVTRENLLHGAYASAGKPLQGANLYIVNSDLEVVPLGGIGEVLIGGDLVTRGYFGDAEKTNEKFVQTKFGRLYRTGDIGQLLPDGSLMVLGRLDSQVKLRGLRVELGEIESCVSNFKSIQSAAVLIDDADVIRAFYIEAEAGLVDVEELTRFAHSKLPDYMVPASFQKLEKLPLNKNGKLDLLSLKKLALKTKAIKKNETIELDEVSEKVHAVFCKVLGHIVENYQSSFYSLGGSSLKLIQLSNELGKVFSSTIPVIKLLRKNSIVEISSIIKGESLIKINTKVGDEIQEPLEVNQIFVAPSSIQDFVMDLNYSANEHNFHAVLDAKPSSIKSSQVKSCLEMLCSRNDFLRVSLEKTSERLLFHCETSQPTIEIIEVKSEKTLLNEATEIQLKEKLFSFSYSVGEPVAKFVIFENSKNYVSRILIFFQQSISDRLATDLFIDSLNSMASEIVGKNKILGIDFVQMSTWLKAYELYAASDLSEDLSNWTTLPWQDLAKVKTIQGSVGNKDDFFDVKDYRRLVESQSGGKSLSVKKVEKLEKSQLFICRSFEKGSLEIIQSQIENCDFEIVDFTTALMTRSLQYEAGGSLLPIYLPMSSRVPFFDGVDVSDALFRTMVNSYLPLELNVGSVEEQARRIFQMRKRLPKNGMSVDVAAHFPVDDKFKRMAKQLPKAQVYFNFYELEEASDAEGMFWRTNDNFGFPERQNLNFKKSLVYQILLVKRPTDCFLGIRFDPYSTNYEQADRLANNYIREINKAAMQFGEKLKKGDENGYAGIAGRV